MLFHTVLISFRPDSTNKQRAKAYADLKALGKKCGGERAGVLFWQVKKNLDLRKNVHLVELSFFKDKNAFQAFRKHPMHDKVTRTFKEIADWQVGDFITNKIPI